MKPNILTDDKNDSQLEKLKLENEKLKQQNKILLDAIKFVARPWPQRELANINYDVAKQALQDVQDVK
jgi:hypothetical protein